MKKIVSIFVLMLFAGLGFSQVNDSIYITSTTENGGFRIKSGNHTEQYFQKLTYLSQKIYGTDSIGFQVYNTFGDRVSGIKTYDKFVIDGQYFISSRALQGKLDSIFANFKDGGWVGNTLYSGDGVIDEPRSIDLLNNDIDFDNGSIVFDTLKVEYLPGMFSNVSHFGHFSGETRYGINCMPLANFGSTAFGANAMENSYYAGPSNGKYNCAFGYQAMQANTIGYRNVVIGYRAMYSGDLCKSNVVIGYNTGMNMNDVDNNTIIGANAGGGVSGDNNLILGSLAGNAAGIGNMYLGSSSGKNNYGNYNICMGSYAGNNADGDYNIYIGPSQGDSETEDGILRIGIQPTTLIWGDMYNDSLYFRGNTRIGNRLYTPSLFYDSDLDITSGGNLVVEADTVKLPYLQVDSLGTINFKFPSTDGQDREVIVTAGDGTTAWDSLGLSDLYNANAAGTSTIIGNNAGLYGSSTGNTAIGYEANKQNTTGSMNTVLGKEALKANTSGASNTAVGHAALTSLIGSSSNTALGWQALASLTSGSNNIGIGFNIQVTDGSSYQLNIGDLIRGNMTAGMEWVALGDQSNTASGTYSVIVGGESNTASEEYSGVFGGSSNTASGNSSGVIGGSSNTASGEYSGIVGGESNTASGDYSSVFGGEINTTSGEYSGVVGGNENTASGDGSVVLGGSSNKSESYGTVSLGRYNVGGGTAGSWVATDPLFEIGNGTGTGSRANAMTVYKNGNLDVGGRAKISSLGDGSSDTYFVTDSAGILRHVDFADTPREYTKQQTFNDYELTDANTITWNLNVAQVAFVTITDDRALANPTNMKGGGAYTITIKQDGSGSHTLTYGSAYKFPGGTAPTLSTDGHAVDIMSCVSDGTYMYCNLLNDFK